MPNDPAVNPEMVARVREFLRDYPMWSHGFETITYDPVRAGRLDAIRYYYSASSVLSAPSAQRYVTLPAEPARTPPDGFRFCTECGDEVEKSTVFCECELNPF